MQIYIFTKYWNKSRFKQNLAVIFSETMYLDRRHPFMQKSHFGQNVTYTVFALRIGFLASEEMSFENVDV